MFPCMIPLDRDLHTKLPLCALFCLVQRRNFAFAAYHFTAHPSLSCSGVTVCVMSVLGVKPGQMGDSVILSRLEKGSDPVTVHIPTSKQQVRTLEHV